LNLLVLQQNQTHFSVRVKLDILFLVDASSFTGRQKFEWVKLFLVRLIQSYQIHPDFVRLVAVLYSDTVKEYNFPGSKIADLTNKYVDLVEKFPYLAKVPNMAKGMDAALTIFKNKKYLRYKPGIKTVLVTIGSSNAVLAQQKLVKAKMESVNAMKIQSYAVVLGEKKDLPFVNSVFLKKNLFYLSNDVESKMVDKVKYIVTIIIKGRFHSSLVSLNREST
jgi:hypothetical protein